ncbi:MAG: hypothetical protein RJA90_692, partial [Bacteroidota bacterium]
MMYFKKGESISKVTILLVWLTIALFSNSCTKEGASQFKMKPNAFGEIASLVVVADKEIWDGPIGDTIRYYYSSAYLILPQPEPILDLKYFSPTDFKNVPLKRELKSYLIGEFKFPTNYSWKIDSVIHCKQRVKEFQHQFQ